MNKPAPALALSKGQRQTLQRLSSSTSAANRLVVRSRAPLLAPSSALWSVMPPVWTGRNACGWTVLLDLDW